jgi:hypothetical protein
MSAFGCMPFCTAKCPLMTQSGHRLCTVTCRRRSGRRSHGGYCKTPAPSTRHRRTARQTHRRQWRHIRKPVWVHRLYAPRRHPQTRPTTPMGEQRHTDEKDCSHLRGYTAARYLCQPKRKRGTRVPRFKTIIFERCPLLAQSGHAELHCTCPLLTQSRHWRSQNGWEAVRYQTPSFDSRLKRQLY